MDVSLFPPMSSFRRRFASRMVFGIPGLPGINTSWLSRAHSSSNEVHPANSVSGSRMSLFEHTSRNRKDLQSPMESGRRTSAFRDALSDTSDVKLPSPSGSDDRSLSSSESRVSARNRPTDSASAPSNLLRRASRHVSRGVHVSSVSGSVTIAFLDTISSVRARSGPEPRKRRHTLPFQTQRSHVSLGVVIATRVHQAHVRVCPRVLHPRGAHRERELALERRRAAPEVRSRRRSRFLNFRVRV